MNTLFKYICYISLQANGLRVLSLIPGFDLEQIPGQWIDRAHQRSWIPEAEETLGLSDVYAKGVPRYEFKAKGVERPGFQQLLTQTAKNHGIEVHWGHSLVSLDQEAEEVRVRFENGHSDTASFVVGCDGLHSTTRASLFGREKADFTGLTQVI